MTWEETTIMHPLKYRLRYRYFESGHKCNIKIKKENWKRRIMCDCSVNYQRKTRLLYKPIEWIIGLTTIN